MADLESIALRIAEITEAVNATTSAVSSYVAGNYEAADNYYTSAQNIISDYSTSSYSGSTASYQDAASGAASYWDTALGQAIRGVDTIEDTVIQDTLGYYTGANISYVSAAQTTEAVITEDLDGIGGFIQQIGDFILAGIEKSISGVSDFVQPILLSVETLLGGLIEGLKEIPVYLESFKTDLLAKFEELLSFEEKDVDAFIEQFKKTL